MGNLGNISGKEAIKAFEKAGWQNLGRVGNHVVLVKPGVRANLESTLVLRKLGALETQDHDSVRDVLKIILG